MAYFHQHHLLTQLKVVITMIAVVEVGSGALVVAEVVTIDLLDVVVGVLARSDQVEGVVGTISPMIITIVVGGEKEVILHFDPLEGEDGVEDLTIGEEEEVHMIIITIRDNILNQIVMAEGEDVMVGAVIIHFNNLGIPLEV